VVVEDEDASLGEGPIFVWAIGDTLGRTKRKWKL
jgi:hypothetical protein